MLSGKGEGFVLSGDKKKICYVQGMDTTKPIYIGTDGNLSAAGNWLDGTVPTGGNGDAQIFCASALTLTVGDTFAPAKLVIPDGSALVTIGSGTLWDLRPWRLQVRYRDELDDWRLVLFCR